LSAEISKEYMQKSLKNSNKSKATPHKDRLTAL